MLHNEFVQKSQLFSYYFVFLLLPGLEFGKNETKLIQWRNQIGPIPLSYFGIIRVWLIEFHLLSEMFIHNFIIKLIKFLDFLLFAFNNFFKNDIIVCNPNMNALERSARKLNDLEHEFMKPKGIRPKKWLHIFSVSFFAINSKDFSLLIFEGFFKFSVVFYLFLKDLKESLMQIKAFYEGLLFFLF